MAQHPFAAQAREAMEKEGIVFNTDGSTAIRVVTNNTITPTNDPNHEVPDTTEEKPVTPPVEEGTETEVTDKDRLIAMQREEIERLKNGSNTQRDKEQSPSGTPEKSAREIELEQELLDLRDKIDQQTKSQQADEFRELLDRQGFDSEHLDDDVLIEIGNRLIIPVASKLELLEQRLSNTETKLRDPTPEEVSEQTRAKTAAALRTEIPDFDTIYNSKDFQAKLLQQDSRYPFKSTYGHVLQEAYENGKTEFIVNEVKAFMRGTTPDLSAIADVGAMNGVGTGQSTTENKPGFTYSNEEAAQMLRKVQRGDISRREYSEYRAKLEESRSSRNH